MKADSLVAIILLAVVIIVVIGIVMIVQKHEKVMEKQSAVSMRALGDGLVTAKIDKKHFPFIKGVKNLEPNSIVFLDFDDFRVAFKANAFGELMFALNGAAIPYGCLTFVDAAISMTPKSAQTFEFMVGDGYPCGPMMLNLPILAANGEAKILRIGVIDRGDGVMDSFIGFP